MSKKLITILLLLFISLCSLIFITFYYTDTSSAPQPKRSIIHTEIPTSTLSAIPNQLSITSGENASIDIVLDTSKNVSLVQLEIAYDPYALTSVNIFPGNYFIGPEIVLEKIDYKNGRISYAIKCPLTKKADTENTCTNSHASIVATITFTATNYGFQKKTDVSFLPKTSIRSDLGEIELRESIGTTIKVSPSFYTPIASPSGQALPIQP